jgi:prepilin peptidase CpaA
VSWLTGILLGVVLIAAAIDLRTRRIPNWLTFTSIALGLVLQFVAAGPQGLLFGFLGVLVGGGLFFLPFLLGGMGAGDLKLMAAAGAFLGPKGALWAVLCTGIAGGVLALLWSLLHGRLTRALGRTGELIGAMADPRRRNAQGGLPTLEKHEKWTIPYGVAIAFGVALSLWWRGL